MRDLLRPPVWPLAVALGLAGLGGSLALRSRRRLAATLLFLEATTLVVFAYATYVGL